MQANIMSNLSEQIAFTIFVHVLQVLKGLMRYNVKFMPKTLLTY